ncbi:MAG: prepilin-type N-terminal cleavage/methylation domain-containing protein [Burkholderiales bacterium]|nr:prepilin-type N-terminal cleavage/methylation domain-containing protein [Burkholderiales bacterium]
MNAVSRRHNGFTLVELAIVLVIIGLLLGGALKGAAVIKNAQMQDLIQAVKDTQAAAIAFQQKYGYYPGDLPNAVASIPGVGGCSGDGNGYIDAGESNCARDELILSGLLRGTVGAPLLVEGSTISLVRASSVAGLPANWGNVVVVSNLNCESAYFIDQALDDSNTLTGNFRAPTACPAPNPGLPAGAPMNGAFRIN